MMKLEEIQSQIQNHNDKLRATLLSGIDSEKFTQTSVYKSTGIHNYTIKDFLNGKELVLCQLVKINKFIQDEGTNRRA